MAHGPKAHEIQESREKASQTLCYDLKSRNGIQRVSVHYLPPMTSEVSQRFSIPLHFQGGCVQPARWLFQGCATHTEIPEVDNQSKAFWVS